MALLGAQLVITLVMVSIIQKIGPHYSLARWLLCSTGLTHYLYPTDDELRSLAGVPKDKPKSKKERNRQNENGKPQKDTFHIPRNLNIQLESVKVSAFEVIHLRYYAEYQWLLDFSLYASMVYIITEVYTFFLPLRDEVNLSMLWCMLVLGFSFKVLLMLTAQYFKGEESVGERSTVIVTSFVYLIISMVVLIIDEHILETGLENAYSSFNESASVFLENHGLDSQGPASKIVLKFLLAVWCALIGALFTFPGLRMAKMHWDALKYCKENKVLWLLLNVSFITPFLLILLWLKPVTKDYLTTRVFSGMTDPLLTVSGFESLRLILVVLAIIQRIALMPVYLQTYLNMAHSRLEEQKKEAGRITNTELQKKIAAVFFYLCVVTLQYIAPLLLCMFSALMYKSLGNYTWGGLFFEPQLSSESPANQTVPQLLGDEDSVLRSAQQITLTLDSLKQVFTRDVYRGVFGFATWWTCFAWFASSSLGMIYQSYFSQA
uniref:Transmembrane protein 161B n=1 Tax=Clastoptera arizonana TaxID=38151 RepID=A0A1B6E2L2_9HEMI